jgi:POT family proton-dependent oligopeptide transporter
VRKEDAAGAPLPLNPTELPIVGSDEKKAVSLHPSSDGYDEHEGEYPTAEEIRTLRHIGDPLPKSAFLVAVVELCERFTFYGVSGIFQNYIQRPLDGSLGRGALGMID